MPTRLLALALLAPTLTLAQEAGPASGGHTRDSWYIGVGLGTGSGNVSLQDGTKRTFSDLNLNRDTTNVALNFKVGATLSQTLLLGFDWTTVRAQASDDLAKTYVQISNYDAMLTWFPWQAGFLLRGGLGLSALTLDGGSAGSSTYVGGNLLVGAGYAVWLGDRFNLTIDLDVSAQGYGNGTSGPKSSALWALWVGFDWY